MKPSFADWRAQVEKELAGASFDKLVTPAPEGPIQPLYTERVAPAPVLRAGGAFEVCLRGADSGAEALWATAPEREAIAAAVERGASVVVDAEGTPQITHFKPVMKAKRAWLGFDPIDELRRGELRADELPRRLNDLGAFARRLEDQRTGGTLGATGHAVRGVRVGSVGYHVAGADAVEELALVLATAAAYLRALVAEGLDVAQAAHHLWVQVAVGRDTFGELCKLRALRLVWWKLFAAAGHGVALEAIHAVCSPRTQALRDPWVNMLRVTTEVFSAVLGGAQLVTPLAFDEAFGASELGARTARNTALVLREESHLGRVVDAAGGSYYLEARTDALARAAWARFGELERGGGIAAQLGEIEARLAKAWEARQAVIAKRKEPVLGVSEFANVGEQLPGKLPAHAARHDGERFEVLRARVEGTREVVVIALGPAAEHRARVGYAQGFFAVAGLAAKAGAEAEAAKGAIAVVCGSDERYATEALAVVEKLKEAGAAKIVLAGRPGALEAPLREAGVTCIYVGCDVLATLEEIVS